MILRVVFMGSPEFSVPTLRALDEAFTVTGVFTQPDRPRGRGRKTSPTEVKAAAFQLGLPVETPNRPDSPEALELLEAWSPDVIVVAAYGRILPKVVLDFPPMGCINLHASLLPRHRGASPITAAILAGDEETGVCAIMMDEGMDTGDILMCETIPIRDRDTAGSLHDRMLEPGAELIVKTLRLMKAGRIEPKPQNDDKATYTRPLTKDDGRLDWTEPADALDRRVRAMNPWPGAFSTLRGESVKIPRSRPSPGDGRPGAIVDIREDGFATATGDGLLVIEEIQAPGKKRMNAAEFARGRRLEIGESFDVH